LVKKSLIFCFALILVGFLDWLTTVVGVAFSGASETNPLLIGILGSNMALFSVVKLFAVVATGLAFYIAVGLSTNSKRRLTKRFLDVSYLLTFLILTTVVINNLSVVLKF